MSYVSFDRVDWNADRTDAEWKELAENLRSASRRNWQEKEDSWQRSDTDGFLSQWASGVTAAGNSLAATLADDKGLIEYDALFTLDGEVASTHHGYSQFGEYWRLNDEAAKQYGKPFFNPSKARNEHTRIKNNAEKGFYIGKIRVRGRVMNLASPNSYNITYGLVPIIDRLKAGDYEVIDNGNS